MRYHSTVEAAQSLEDLIRATGSCTIRQGKPKGDIQGDKEQQTAYNAVYELYLTQVAQNTLESGRYLDALLYPHAVIRIMYFHRENRAEVTLGNDKLAKICALYPTLAQPLADMQYCEHNRRGEKEKKVVKKYLTP